MFVDGYLDFDTELVMLESSVKKLRDYSIILNVLRSYIENEKPKSFDSFLSSYCSDYEIHLIKLFILDRLEEL